MGNSLRRFEDIGFEQLSEIEQSFVVMVLQEKNRRHSIEGAAIPGEDKQMYIHDMLF